MFILVIQIFLCVAVWVQDEFRNAGLCNDVAMNLAIFFVVLAMHFGSVMTVRNGINMCMYVIYHPDNFENPKVAFLLGIFTQFANAFAASTNLASSLNQRSAIDVVQKFVGFKILIQVQDYYMRSRDQFKIKKAVSNDLVVVKDKSKI